MYYRRERDTRNRRKASRSIIVAKDMAYENDRVLEIE
jgi:hypothetical protein